MKIAIDARVLSRERGISRYTKNIIENLGYVKDYVIDYVIIVDNGKALDFLGARKGKFEVVAVPQRSTFRDHFFLSSLIKKLGVDLFFHPDNREFLRMPFPSVVTIHDLTPYKYPDYIFDRRFLMRERQKFYYFLQKRAILKNTDHIITVSENTRKDVLDIFGFPEKKVTAIYEGIEGNFRPKEDKREIEDVKEKYGIVGEYIFYVGGLGKHKNVETLVRAFRKVTESGMRNKELGLVIGGKTMLDDTSGQNAYSDLVRLVDELGLTDRVSFPGFTEEEDLPAIYSGAICFVFPSLYEGFGFPVLEAMACGCPVVSSNAGSLPEIVGDSGILVSPKDIEGFAEAISSVILDKSKKGEMVEMGLERAKRFSWEECAKKTLQVFENVHNSC